MIKPFETDYRRWRHIKHGYRVNIIGIQHFRGDKGYYYSQVVVEGSLSSKTRRVAWSADIFRENFEPVGRKEKARSALEQILTEDIV